ncbi:MAG: hypothetical protein ACKPKO_55590, partial [Candidatus Fonsibacter sp.]
SITIIVIFINHCHCHCRRSRSGEGFAIPIVHPLFPFPDPWQCLQALSGRSMNLDDHPHCHHPKSSSPSLQGQP